MAISETTALARARAVRATFPTDTITTAQARAMFVAMADSQVGYATGNPNWSMYGKASTWPSGARDWDGRQVYWCALGGGAWTPAWAFGLEAALAGFGRQYPSRAYPPVGGTWTVWVLNWARANGRVVSFNDVQSGDIILTNWGRTGAEVDHFDIATGPRAVNMIPVIGFNTSSGNASAGAGVYRALRPRSRVVAVARPDWAALIAAYNAQVVAEEVIGLTRVAASLIDLGYPATQAGVRAFQSDKHLWGHNLTVDGRPGPATEKAIGESMAKIDDILSTVKQIHARQSNLDTGHNNIVRRLTEALEKVPAAVWAHRNPAHSGNRDAHGLLRDAATAKQIAAKNNVLTQAQINDTED